MYLGLDVLQHESGDLTPIRWLGFENFEEKYQGAVRDKKSLLQYFDLKLKKCEADPSATSIFDFNDIRAILDLLRTAFQQFDSERILIEEFEGRVGENI